MEGLLYKSGKSYKVDLLGALEHCASNRRAAKRIFDECEVEVDSEGGADPQIVCEELRDRFPKSAKADELIDFLEPPEESLSSQEDQEISSHDVKLKLTILKSLSKVHQCVKYEDRRLAERITLLIHNQLRDVEQWCNSSGEDLEDAIWITDRLNGRQVDKNTLFEIGNRAARYYHREYHRFPIKVPRWIDGRHVLVNKYTERTAEHTLDRAIEEVLGETNPPVLVEGSEEM